MTRLFARLPIFLISFAITACAADDAEPRREEIPIIAQPVAMLPETVEVEMVGTARAVTSAELYAESAGRVTRVRFQAGDYVRKGQPLVELDSRRERLAVEAAEVQVREASQLLDRYRRIEDTGAISESQIEAGETALESAQVSLQQARTALADRTLRAPFAGHVGLTEIDPGDRVNDSTPITQIDQRGRLYVDFSAPEAVFNTLRPGETVKVTPFAQPDRTIDARIVATDSRVSQDSRDFTVRVLVMNGDDRLRPGMSFRVAVERRGDARPAVPEQAIAWGGEGSYLFVVREQAARRVPVTITARRDGLAFVDAQLTANDRVIVEGVQKVRDGQAIRLVQPKVAPKRDVPLRDGGTPDGA